MAFTRKLLDFGFMIKDFIAEEDFSPFHEWAFGLPPEKSLVLRMFADWNRRHGDKLILNEDTIVERDLKKIAEFYYRR